MRCTKCNVLIRLLLAGGVVLGLLVIYRVLWVTSDDPLVVYCAHDATFSRQILDAFERETSIAVEVRFDNEATKSLGLTQQIIAEKDNPRCDVFWNNQMLGTMDLARRGLLQPYKGPGYLATPDRYKDPDGLYTGFAARLRVWIINTEQLEATPRAVLDYWSGDLSRAAIARPIWGTTLTHYTVLWDVLGEQGIKKWRRQLHQRHIVERGGNATVKDLVASGQCALGLTDTDDFFVARDAGKPVAMLPVRVGRDDQPHQVISIPNTVAIIRGTKKLDAARRLVDYLLSTAVQLKLANSRSRQLPLRPVEDAQLPDDVRKLAQWADDGYDLRPLYQARLDTLNWLTSENIP